MTESLRVIGVLSLLTALPLAGCGSTGLSWVAEAHGEATQQTAVASESHASPRAVEPIPAEPAPDPELEEDAPRPRLRHTVTLGEGEVMGATGRTASASPAGGAGVSVTVNNYNVLNAPSIGYGYARSYSPGYFRGSLGSSSYSRPSSVGSVGSSPQPGQNWPAISDNGPSYPFRAAPASPWSRTP